MAPAVLHGTINLASSATVPNERPSFDSDQFLNIYIEDTSQVPKTGIAHEHPKTHGSILLGETRINLARDQEFPLVFQCEYDPTKATNGQFEKLCEEGSIVVEAEVDAEGREMTAFWLKSGAQKFEQNIKLTLTGA